MLGLRVKSTTDNVTRLLTTFDRKTFLCVSLSTACHTHTREFASQIMVLESRKDSTVLVCYRELQELPLLLKALSCGQYSDKCSELFYQDLLRVFLMLGKSSQTSYCIYK